MDSVTKSYEAILKNDKEKLDGLHCKSYLIKSQDEEQTDNKWFCFDVQLSAMFITTDCFNKEEETKFDFYEMDFNIFHLLTNISTL